MTRASARYPQAYYGLRRLKAGPSFFAVIQGSSILRSSAGTEDGLRRTGGPRFEVRGSRFEVRGSRFEVRGSRSFEVRGSRLKVRGSKFEVRCSAFALGEQSVCGGAGCTLHGSLNTAGTPSSVRSAMFIVFRCREITEVRGGFSSRSVVTPLLRSEPEVA